MQLNNLFFHIHYCNGRKFMNPRKYLKKITRAIQHHELAFVTKGKGSIAFEQKRYPVKEGTLIYISPDMPHALETDADDPACFLTVHFSFTRVNFSDGEWGLDSETKILPLNTVQELKDYHHVEDIFDKVVDTWNRKLPGYEFITRTFLQQLLIAIYENTKNQNQNYSLSLKIEKVIHYMHQTINGKVTLTELSEMAQLSPAYLSREFKEMTGYSVIEYFNKIKIDKAKELIIDGNKRVKEIAQSLGFYDEFYFSRLFKKKEGISPSEYYSKNVRDRR